MSDTYTTVVGSGSDQERIAAVVETGSSPAFIAGHLLDSVRVMRAEEELARRLVEFGLEGSARVRRITLPEDRGALLRFVREWEQKHRRAVTAGTIATLVLPLAACGGGGGGGYRPPVDEGDSGWVIDGYVSAATVSRENVSGNTVTTDASGRFTGLTGTGPIVATGGIDVVTGQPVGFTMRAPEGATVISPLTTLVQALIDDGASSTAAYASVAEKLGLTADQLRTDPFATESAENLAVIKAAVQVASVLRVAVTAGAAPTDAAAALVKALSTSFDLSNEGTLASFLGGLGITSAENLATTLAEANSKVAAADTLANLESAQSLPTVTITLSDVALKAGETATVTFTFSEEPTGFGLEDVQAANGQLTNLLVKADSGGLVYTATFTPNAAVEDTTNVITVGTGWSDNVGNAPAAITTSGNYSIDTKAPTVALSTDDAALNIGDTATITLTFTEAPATLPAVTPSAGTLSALVQDAQNPLVYTATLTPPADTAAGNITFTVGAWADAAGNAGSTSAAPTIAVDTVAPTVALSTDDAALNIGDTATITLTFTEAPATLPAVTPSAGTLSALVQDAQNPLVYTATLTPPADTAAGSITFTVGAWADAAGNAGSTSAAPTIAVDTVAPTVALSTDDAALNIGDTATITLTFTEAPATLPAVTPSAGTLSVLVQDAQNPLVYTATLTPPADTAAGSITFTVGAWADAAGNAGSTSAAPTIAVDTVAPTVALSTDDAALNIGDTATITLTFTEAPATLPAVTPSAGTLSALVQDAQNPLVYTATLTPPADTAAGNITFTVGAWADAAGNAGSTSAAPTIAVDTVAPTVALSTDDAALNIGDTATITLTFTEAPATLPAVTPSAGTLSALVQDAQNPLVYTATLTPPADTAAGSITFTVGAWADAAGNAGSTSAAPTIAVDTVAPTVALSTDDAALNIGDTATITLTFTEAPATLPAVTPSAGTLSVLVQDAQNPLVYTATLTPPADTAAGSITFTVGAWADAAGNAGSTSAAPTIAVDTVAPTVALSTDDAALNIGDTATITLTFTEAPATLPAVTPSAGTLSALVQDAQNPLVYTATLTPPADTAAGNITFTVGAWADAAGNAGSTSAAPTIAVDTVAPTVALSTDDAALNIGDTATITLTFTEAPATLPAVTPSAGTLSALVQDAQNPLVYTATLTPPADTAAGSITFTVGAWADAAGNAGSTSAAPTIAVDTVAPTVALSTDDAALNIGDTATITLTFTEAPATLPAVTPSAGTLSVLVQDAQNPLVYTATLTPPADTAAGSITFTVGAWADAAGNAGSTSAAPTIAVDTVAPTVALSTDDAALNIGDTATITLTFTEAPATLPAVTPSAGTLSALVQDAQNPLVYTATLTPPADTAAGNITFTVGAWADAAGNAGSTSAAPTIAVDTVAPTVALSTDDAALNIGDTATITLTFTEAPATLPAVTPSAGTLSALVQDAQNPLVYTATLTPPADTAAGSITFTVGAWADAAGNAGSTSAAPTIAVDTVAPTVALSTDDAALNIGDTATITLTFTEAPATLPAVTPSAGTLSVLVQDAQNPLVYTATLTPPADTAAGSITFTVGAWADAAGNAGSTSAAPTIAVDTVAPTVALSTDDAALNIGDTATITLTFTEAPATLPAVTPSAGTLSALVQDAQNPLVYTATLTPPADTAAGNITFTVGAWADAAGNAGSTSAAPTIAVDTVAPTVALSTDDAALNIGDTATITLTFTEAPATLPAVTPSAGTLSALVQDAQNPLVYTATLTPPADTAAGSITFTVGAWADAAGNAGSTSAAPTIAVDTVAPTVALSTDDAALNIGDTATITLTFTEAPATLPAVTPSAGTLSVLVQDAQNPLVYTATLTPPADTAAGSITFTVGAWADAAGNAGSTSAAPTIAVDTVAPTVALSTDDAALNIGDTATITLTFTEAPATLPAVTPSAGTLSALVQDAQNPLVYTATLTPPADTAAGSITFTVGAWADAAGNAGSTSAAPTIAVDTVAPTVALSTDDAALNIGDTATITLTFTEAPATLPAVTPSAGTLSALVQDAQNPLVYTATLTPPADTAAGSITFTVGAWADAAGNAGSTSAAPTIAVDTVAPTVAIDAISGGYVNDAEDESAVTVSGTTDAEVGQVVTVTLGENTYQATVVAGAQGQPNTWTTDVPSADIKELTEGTITVKADVSDAAGNAATQASQTFVYDVTAPTITSATTASIAENVAAGTQVYDANATDANTVSYQLKAGSTSGLAIDPATGVVTLTEVPDFETKPSYSFTVVATDAAGNATEQAVVLAVTDVNEAPTAVTLLNATTSLPGSTTTANRIKLADILVTDDALGTNTVSLTGRDAGSFEVEGGALYLKRDVTIDFDAQASYEVSVSVQDSTIPGSAAVTTNYTLTITEDADVTPPDAPVVALANDTGSSPTDKITSDGRLSVTGETSATIEYSTDSGVNWTTTFTPVEGANTVWVRQTDTSGNISAHTVFTFTLDTTAPTVTIASSDTGTANIANGTLTYTFTFSEPVSGFTIDDVDVENGEKGLFTQVDASTYQLEVTPDAGLQGSMTLKVAAGAAADVAFNASAAATDYVQAVDTLAPTLSITDDELGEVVNAAGGDIVFSFRFSEVVSNFALEDVNIVGGTASGALIEATGADAGKLFTLVVTPTANYEGNLTVSVAQGAVTDLNGNPLAVEVSATQAVDTKAPSVPSINVVAGNDFIIALEKDAGVSLSGTAEANTEVLLTLGAGNLRSVTADAQGAWTYTLNSEDYSAMGEGAETIRAIARDAAGNQSAEATRAVSIDTVLPTLAITLGSTALTLGQSVSVTFQFSEAPLNFTAADISLGSSSAVLENLTVDAQDATKYTATLRASKNLSDAESVIQVGTDWTDAAGNAPAAATSSANYAVTAVSPIVVNADGGGNFTSLKAAVDASVAGNDIRIDAGSFNASAYPQASTDALKALNSLTLANGVSLTLTAAQASGETIVAQGAANVVLTGLQLGTTAADGPTYDFTNTTLGTGALNATVSTTGVLNANSTLGALALGVASGQTLTLSAAQANGRSVTGLGSAVVTDLASTPAANLSGLLLSSATAAVDGSLTFTGTLGAVAVAVNSGVFTTSAAIASGKTISGAGSVSLTGLEATPAADLSKITASTVSATLATSAGTAVSFSGNTGKAVVSVTGDGELQLAPTATLGTGTAFDLAAGTSMSASAAQLSGTTVTGTGTVNVAALAADTDLAGLADDLNVIATVGESIDISTNVNLGSVDSFVVAAGQTLTLSAAQADGATISGDGAVVLIGLGAATDLAGVTPTGGSTVTVAAGLTFAGDLGSTEVTLANNATFTTTASIASGKTIDGAGIVTLTGLESALGADLTGIDATTLNVTATTSGTHSFIGSLGKAAVTVAGSGTLALDATADLGAATFTVEAGATLRGSAEQLAGVSIGGAGTVEVLALAAGSDLSSLSLATNVVAIVESSLDITANANLGSVDAYEVGAGQTLTLTAAQANGKSIIGTGRVVITDLDATPAADLNGVIASGGVTIPVDTSMSFTGTLSANAALTVAAGVQLSMDAALVDAHAVSGDGELKVSGSIASTDFNSVLTQSVDLTAATLGDRTTLSLNDTSQFVITPAQSGALSITGTAGANTLIIDVSGLDFSGSPPEVTVVVSTGEGADRVQFRFGEGADTRTVKLSAESSITMGGGTDILESANGKLDISAADIDFSTIETLQINSTIVLSADQLQLLLNVLGGQLGGLVGGGVIEVVGNLTSGTIDLNKFGSFTPGGLTPPTIRFPEGYTDDPANQNNFTAPPAGSTVIIQIANGTGGYDTYGAFDGSGFTPTAVTVFTEAQLVAAAESATVQTIALGKAITLNTAIDLSDTTVALVTAADKQLTLGSSGSVTMTATQANGADIAGTGSVTVVVGTGVSTLAELDFSGILAPATLQVTGTLDARGASLGQFAVDVAAGGVLTLEATQVAGRSVSGTGQLVLQNADAAPAANYANLASGLTVTAEFDGSASFTGNFGGVDQVLVSGTDTVLTVGAAAISGRSVTGNGAVTVNNLTASADLSGVAVTGAKLANIGSNLIFSGKFGGFDVVVAGSRTLTTTADKLSGVEVSGAGRVALTNLVEGADLSGLVNTGGKLATVSADTTFSSGRLASGFTLTIVGGDTTLTTTPDALNGARVLGTGEVVLSGVASGDDLSNILVTGAKQVLVAQSADFTNVNLGAFSLEVADAAVLILSAAQASGRLIGGEGGVYVTALGASTDLSGVSAAGVKTATVASDLVFTGKLGGFALGIAASATLTVSAARLDGKVVTGTGNLVVTGLTSGASPDLSKVASTGTKLLQIDGNVELATDFAVPSGFTLAVSAGSGLTATADQLSGLTVTGAGSVTVKGLSATADLDGIVVTGARLVEVLESVTFSGSLGDGFQFVVAEGATLKTSAETLDNVFVFGAGNVTLTGVDASVDLSRLLVSGSRSIEVTGTSNLTGAELADFSITLVGGAVLTLSADQVTGRTIDGEGTLKITGLGSLSIDDLEASIGAGVSVQTTLPVVSITTPIAGDGVVNAAEAAAGVVVTGTATNADGQTLILDFAGVQFSAVVSNGTWSVTVPPTILRAIGDAPYTVQATVSSADGNTGGASTQVVVDASVPAAPTFAVVAGNDVINATEATDAFISGMAEANATVELRLGGQVKTLTADDDGNWSYTLGTADYTAMGQGSETLSAVAIDAAGNRSPVATKVIQIDTVAPSVAITDDEPGVANIAGGDVVFTFTFSEAVTGFSADDVTVSNGSKGAFAQLSATTYSLVVTPNAGFEGNLTVDVAAGAAQDAAGNVSLAAAQRVQAVDTLAPVVTVSALGGADKVVSTLVGDNVVSGSGEAGRNVTLLSSSGAVLGTVRADTTTGSWTYTLTADNLAVLGQGADSITARQTDAAGNVGQSAAFAFSVDTVAPSLTINPIAGDDLLVFAESQEGLVISGTATGVEDGRVVNVRFNSVDYVATVSNGTWSTDSIVVSSLQNGVYPVTASVTDAAGNPAQAAVRNLTVALEAPAISIGVVAGDDVLNIIEAGQPLTLSGTAANIADDTAITVRFNGVDYAGTVVAGSWSVTVPAINLAGLTHGVSYTVSASAAGATASRVVSTDLRAPTITVNAVTGDDLINIAEKASGFVVSGTASAGAEVTLQLGSLARSFTASADGTWSYRFEPADVSGFAQGNYVLAASARDAAGNVGTAAQRTIGFDLTAPAAATVALVEDTGANTTDRLTRNGTLSVTGVEQGASVSYSTDGGVTWAASFTPVEGLNNVKVRVSDAAGNRAVTDFSFTLDTATAAPRVALLTDSGASASDGITDVGTLNVTGVEAGAVVEYSVDGGQSWSGSFAPVVGVNAVQVRATDLAGNQATTSFTFTLDISTPAPVVSLATDSGSSNADRITNDGTLSIDAEAGASLAYSIDGGVSWSDSFIAVEGANAVRVRATDLAGNQATSDFSFTLDTTAPAQPVIDSAALTNLAEPVLSGTAEVGSTVEVNVGGAVYKLVADAQGGWSVDLATATPITGTLVLGDGSYTVSVTATDTAGNESVAAIQALVIDTLAPAQPLITSLPAAGIDFPVISGSAEANSTVSLSIGGAIYSVAAGTQGTWSVDLATATPSSGTLVLGDGTFAVSAIATDAAGNASAPASQSLVIDTVTPVLLALNAAPSAAQLGVVLVQGAAKLGIDLGEFQALDPSVQASVVNDLFVNRPANGYMTPATVDGIFDAVIDVYQALAATVLTANAMTVDTPLAELEVVVQAAADSFTAALGAGVQTVGGQVLVQVEAGALAAVADFGALGDEGKLAFVGAVVDGQPYGGFSALLTQSQAALVVGQQADALAALNAADATTIADVLAVNALKLGIDLDEYEALTVLGPNVQASVLNDLLVNRPVGGYTSAAAADGVFDAVIDVYQAVGLTLSTANAMTSATLIANLLQVVGGAASAFGAAVTAGAGTVAGQSMAVAAPSAQAAITSFGTLGTAGQQAFVNAVVAGKGAGYTSFEALLAASELAFVAGQQADGLVALNTASAATIADVLAVNALKLGIDLTEFAALSANTQLAVLNDLLVNRPVGGYTSAATADGVFDAVIDVYQALAATVLTANAMTVDTPLAELEVVVQAAADSFTAALGAGVQTVGGQVLVQVEAGALAAVADFGALGDAGKLAFVGAVVDGQPYGGFSALLTQSQAALVVGQQADALAALNAADATTIADVLAVNALKLGIDLDEYEALTVLGPNVQASVLNDLLVNRPVGGYTSAAAADGVFDAVIDVYQAVGLTLSTANAMTSATPIANLLQVVGGAASAFGAAVTAGAGTVAGQSMAVAAPSAQAAITSFGTLGTAGQQAFVNAVVAGKGAGYTSFEALLAASELAFVAGQQADGLVALNTASAATIADVLAVNALKLGIDLTEFAALSANTQLAVLNDLLVNRPVGGYTSAATADGVFDAVIDVYQALAATVLTANAMTVDTPLAELEAVVQAAADSFTAALGAGVQTVGGQVLVQVEAGALAAVADFGALGDAGKLAFVGAVVDGQPYGGFSALLTQSQAALVVGQQADALAALNAADATTIADVLAVNALKLGIDLDEYEALTVLGPNVQASVLNDLLVNRPVGGYTSAAAADGVFDAVIDVYQAVGLTLSTANAMTSATPIANLLQVVGGAASAFGAAVTAGAGTVAGQSMAVAAPSAQAAITSFGTLGTAGQQAFVNAVVAGKGAGYTSFEALLAASELAFVAGQQADGLVALNTASAATIADVLAVNALKLGIDLTEFAALSANTQLAVLNDLLVNRPVGGYTSAATADGVFDAVIDVYQAVGLTLSTANAMTSATPIANLLQVVGGAASAFGAAVTAGAGTVAGQSMAVAAPSAQAAITSFGTLGTAGQQAFVNAVVAGKGAGYTSFEALLAVSQGAFVLGQQADALAEVNASADPGALGDALVQYADRFDIDLGAGSDYAALAARQPQLLADLLANKLANFATGFQTAAQVKALFDAGVALRTEIVQVLDMVNAADPSMPLADISFLSDLLASFGSTSLSQAGFTLITSGANVYPLATLVTQGQAAVAFYGSLSGADQAALRLAVSSQDYASFSDLLIAVNNAVVALTPLNVVVAEPGEMLDVTSANDLDLKLVSQDGSTATFAVYVDPLFGTIQSATLDVVFGAGKVTTIEVLSGPTGYLASVEQAGVMEPGEFYPGQDALLFGWNSLTAFDPGLGQALFTFKVGLVSPSGPFDISVIPVDLGAKNYDALTADVVATFDPAPLAIASGTDARDLLIAGPGEVEATGGLGADVFAPTSLATQLTIKDFSGSEAGGQGDKIDFGALLANLGYTAVATQVAQPADGVVLPWLQAALPPSMDNVFAASGWMHANGVGTLTVTVDANASAGVIDVQTLQIAIHTLDPTPLALEELGLTLDLIQYNTPS
ncbi:Ig-like domain-containing protein [Thauera mechernichensis]